MIETSSIIMYELVNIKNTFGSNKDVIPWYIDKTTLLLPVSIFIG